MSWENPRRRRRRTRATPRRRRYTPRWFRRYHRKKPKIPLETMIAGASTFFIPAREGYYAPVDHLQSGNVKGVLYNYLEGFTGIDMDGGKFDFNLGQTLNPFDFSRARYWKLLLYATLLGIVRKRLVRQSSQLIQKIPLIGRIVS